MQIEVEIVYIPSRNMPIKLKIKLAANSTIQDALLQSDLAVTNPEINSFPVGIFGKQKPLTTLLKAGDRIEIYTPLLINPMERRRQRAKKK